MKNRFAAIASLLVSAGLAASAAQAQIVITTNTTITPNDPTYASQDIVVHGCTVTINGPQTFTSLTIERNKSNAPGVVTHDANFSSGGVNGMFLTITGDLLIQGVDGPLVASRIDVTGKGFPLGQGPGSVGEVPDGGPGVPAPPGGSYGGAGGKGSPVNQPQDEFLWPDSTYGLFAAPAELGSGSGTTLQGPPPGTLMGAPGGGAVRVIAGAVTVHGELLADGGTGISGGSGGSIWIDSSSLSGAGTIRAQGGASNFLGGGGGGGRIAIITPDNSFTGVLLASGGPRSGTANGGPGSVFLRVKGNRDQLILDNTMTPATGPFDAYEFVGNNVTVDTDVILRNNASIMPRRGQSQHQHLIINGSLTIDATSVVGADARGPRPAPAGNGGLAPSFPLEAGAGGGGHGGNGGAGRLYSGTPGTPGAPGLAYGDPNAPTTFGGNGGAGIVFPPSHGGGALRLTVSDTIVLNGALSAAGEAGQSSGGAAGGSLWIESPSITGAGSIRARGGNSTNPHSGGGGGRVRIDTCGTFTISLANISVAGGTGFQSGQPGSIVTNSLVAPFASQSFAIDPFVPHETVVLTASAVGSNLTYQWRRNGVDIPEGFGSGRYTGTQTATLTIADPTCADAATIDFVVSNLCAVSSSNAAQLRSAIDWNGDGTVNSTDVSDFINAWFTDQAKGGLVTDINGDGVSNSTDVSDFINFWFEEEPAC